MEQKKYRSLWVLQSTSESTRETRSAGLLVPSLRNLVSVSMKFEPLMASFIVDTPISSDFTFRYISIEASAERCCFAQKQMPGSILRHGLIE
uniref:Uncharacterized protein n=1 Tax=Ditylenchus dipsaci TaxID=166011 RepID=A0A915CSJ9_9BILA